MNELPTAQPAHMGADGAEVTPPNSDQIVAGRLDIAQRHTLGSARFGSRRDAAGGC
ncbi:hypothetical protein [Nocardia sp. R6R-6]|uniref:hypothetical protein n=1 Tax=Nocardia sp. R6R-6 TaxID=3459303 RepID=UPI00403D63E7